MGRIFSVRVNMDDLSASLDIWPTDQERSAWLRGFLLGARGGHSRWESGTPEADGYTIGRSGHDDSQQWRDKKSDAGKRSAEARREKNGSSDPRANREHIVNTVHTQQEHIVNIVRTACEPNQSTNQPINGEPINQSTNQPFPKRKRAAPQRSDAEQFIHDNKFRIKGTDTEKRSSIKDAVSHFGEVQVHTVMDRIRDVWASSLHAEIQTLIRDDFATKAKQDKLREEQNRIFA